MILAPAVLFDSFQQDWWFMIVPQPQLISCYIEYNYPFASHRSKQITVHAIEATTKEENRCTCWERSKCNHERTNDRCCWRCWGAWSGRHMLGRTPSSRCYRMPFQCIHTIRREPLSIHRQWMKKEGKRRKREGWQLLLSWFVFLSRLPTSL